MKILRIDEVKKRVGLSRSSIYLYIKENCFPRPRAIGKRAVGWLESDIDEWIRKRMNVAKASKKPRV